MTLRYAHRLAAAASLAVLSLSASAAPLKALPGLSSITFWEITYSTIGTTFAPNSSALNRISGPLGAGANDFSFYTGEYYDVFYSNAQGVADSQGSYLTIEGSWRAGGLTPYGGMNINEVALNFGGTSVFADQVTHYVYGSTCVPGYGTNCNFSSHLLAVDGNLNTFPRFGQTSDTDLNDRFSLTVGFSAYSVAAVPEPETYALMLAGLGAMLLFKRRSKA